MGATEATRHDQRTTVTVDRGGIIRQWGEAVTEVVGHSADDTVGRSLDIIIPPVLRPLHWWGFDRAMKRGQMGDRPLKVPAVRNDGRIVLAHATIELTLGTLRGADGAVVTFVGVGPQWQGRAWQVALAPLNLVSRIWRRARSNR